MLPMRWRPDATSDPLGLTAFEPDPVALASPARALAHLFWQRVAEQAAISHAFRRLAGEMAHRVRG
jgi:hypothetical protein